ncbi:SufE family protein [Chelatococcus sp. GCM10030263]|uniref:SufE family protein n=1 Tax=Chelatococcus sp. GCM10030263 TaxID=3273387 RepID=UPI00361F1C06
MQPPLDEILDNFEFLDDWDDRYRYLIELGRMLDPLPGEAHTEANKVRGCASQVWLETTVDRSRSGEPAIVFRGDSDAHIVRGLIALAFAIYSGRPAPDILATDAHAVFQKLGLGEHLTPQRSNGLRSMVERIKSDARGVLEGAAVNASAGIDRRTPDADGL